jgi:hypothetical protein
MSKELSIVSSPLRRPIVAAALALMVLASSSAPIFAYHEGPFTDVHAFAHDTFEKTHRRTDAPIISGVMRTWIWGPEAYTEGMLESYKDSPGSMRLVQYFDKSRMEINYPAGDQSNPWYVSNGLLVIDMVEGRYQIGDSEFDPSPAPSTMAIAGDQDGSSDITYAAINQLGLRSKPALPVGSTIIQSVQGGAVVQDTDFASYGVTAAHRVQVDGIDHTIASVFWDFMNSEGLVYVDWTLVNDKLFENPYYGTGYPITEAYWNEFNVGGFKRDVLWQCFERRCLTYTPFNAPAWRVEAGNVGQHYFRWRYGMTGPAMTPVEIGLVALDDNGVLGPAFGCDDSLVMVAEEIQDLVTIEQTIRATIQRLLIAHRVEYYNVFLNKNLIVENVLVSGATATIYLIGELNIGGVCDEPRVTEQLHATATQFAGIDDIVIMLNGAVYDS